MTRISREQQYRARGQPRFDTTNLTSASRPCSGVDRPEAARCQCWDSGSGQLGREREQRNMETRLSADGAIPLRFSPSRRARQRDKTSHGSREMRRSESDPSPRQQTSSWHKSPSFLSFSQSDRPGQTPHSVRFPRSSFAGSTYVGGPQNLEVDETKHGRHVTRGFHEFPNVRPWRVSICSKLQESGESKDRQERWCARGHAAGEGCPPKLGPRATMWRGW